MIEALENAKATIKMKWNGLEWNQFQTEPMSGNMDIFSSLDRVKAYCGAFGNDTESTMCWLDAYNWSLMNKFPITEDIYQFISHRANVIKQGFLNESERWSGVHWEVLKPLWENILEHSAATLNFISVNGLDILSFILEVVGL